MSWSTSTLSHVQGNCRPLPAQESSLQTHTSCSSAAPQSAGCVEVVAPLYQTMPTTAYRHLQGHSRPMTTSLTQPHQWASSPTFRIHKSLSRLPFMPPYTSSLLPRVTEVWLSLGQGAGPSKLGHSHCRDVPSSTSSVNTSFKYLHTENTCDKKREGQGRETGERETSSILPAVVHYPQRACSRVCGK